MTQYNVKWFRKHIVGKSNNKFNARSTYYGGVRYDSKLEATYAMYLDYQIKDPAFDIVDWDRQAKIRLMLNDVFLANYFIDFVEHRSDGTKMYTEVKGMETQLWRLKWKIFCAMWPNIEGVNPGDEYQIVK